MLTGIFAGVMWALETVVIAIALSATPFVSTEEGLFLAPFVSTFLHDGFSAILMWIYNGIKGNLKEVFKVFATKDFKWLVIASAIGGPVGMTGYILAVNCMGASVGAISSAVYPAIGSFLAYLFLKEKMKWYQIVFLLLTLAGVFGISYSPDLNVKNFWLGLMGAFMCAFGWGAEGVILSKALKNSEIKSEYALLIRQTTSGLIYGIFIIPVLSGVKFTFGLFAEENASVLLIIFVAAFCATLSYLLYYKAIAKLGVAKAMGLNITYTAWAVVFSVLIFKDFGILNPVTILCGLLVVVCGILSATDFGK